MTFSPYVDPTALWALAACAILAAVILLAGLLAQGARRHRDRRPGYVFGGMIGQSSASTAPAPIESLTGPVDWAAEDEWGFEDWDDAA